MSTSPPERLRFPTPDAAFAWIVAELMAHYGARLSCFDVVREGHGSWALRWRFKTGSSRRSKLSPWEPSLSLYPALEHIHLFWRRSAGGDRPSKVDLEYSCGLSVLEDPGAVWLKGVAFTPPGRKAVKDFLGRPDHEQPGP